MLLWNINEALTNETTWSNFEEKPQFYTSLVSAG